jgi:hypothetical protein
MLCPNLLPGMKELHILARQRIRCIQAIGLTFIAAMTSQTNIFKAVATAQRSRQNMVMGQA